MRVKTLSKLLTILLTFILVATFLNCMYGGFILSPNAERNLETTKIESAKAPTGWSDDIRVTCCTRSTFPAIAVNANFVHVVWCGPNGPIENPDSYEIYYNRSIDGGKTWENGKMLSIPYGSITSPRIAVNYTNIHVVWDVNEIYYVNSTDNGATWSSPLAISILDSSKDQWPDIAIVGDNVHVIWGHEYTTEQYELCYRNSTDGGKTWNPIQTIENSAATQGDADIAVNGSNVHVVWGAWTPGWETYYKKSSDGGIMWSTKASISKIDGFNSDIGRIAVVGNNVHIVWQDNMGYSADEIHYRNSTDNGDTWNDEINITADDGYYSSDPTIAVNGSNIHVAWIDERDSDGAYEIYYRNSTDGGKTWNPEMRLTTALNNSDTPDIISTEGYTHLVWADNRIGGPTGYEIYYKRSPKFNTPPEINNWYPQTNVTITETQTQLFFVNATDLENDNLTYQWYLSDTLLINETNSSYTFTPSENFSGNYSVKVSVSDGKDFANHTWIVTVINVKQLQETINILSTQLTQLIQNYTALLENFTRLSDYLTSIWSQLNSSELNNTELQTRLQELNENFTTIRYQLNLSNQNTTVLQDLISDLNQGLNISNAQVTVLWSILNQSLANGSEFGNLITQLNQSINSLQGEIEKLKEENEQIVREREAAEERLMIAAVVLVGVILICVLVGVSRKKK